MKKIILSSILLMFASLNINAQDNIASIFLNLPDAVISGLDSEAKDKLLSNPTDTAQIAVSAPLYDDIERLAIADDYIYLQTSPVGTVQIKLLSLINESKIVCVIHTVGSKISDSRISFYTPKWVPIQQGLFPKDTYEWFIKEGVDKESQEYKNAIAALDMNPMKYVISPKDDSISVYYDIKGYLSEDDYKKLEPFLLKQPKILDWDKISYK